MKGVSIDEALCAYLKKYHKGTGERSFQQGAGGRVSCRRDGAAAGGQPPAL